MEFISEEGNGYPEYCSQSCAEGCGAERFGEKDPDSEEEQMFPVCGDTLKNDKGVEDHIKAKHAPGQLPHFGL